MHHPAAPVVATPKAPAKSKAPAVTGQSGGTAVGVAPTKAAPAPAAAAAVASKPMAAAVSCADSQLVTAFHFLINGTTTVSTLKHNVHSGDTVQAFFTIKDGCTARMLMLLKAGMC